MLFIYYLFHQLGFSINQIIAAAPGYDKNGNLNATAPLRGVYNNLTGDNSDPFPFFKQLLDVAYPESQVSSIPGTNPDDPWPLASFSTWGVKNTYGKDEVTDLIASSGRLAGLRLLARARRVQPPGAGEHHAGNAHHLFRWRHLPSIDALRRLSVLRPEGSTARAVQLRHPLRFRPPTLGPFPASGETPEPGNASISVLGRTFSAQTEFFFIAGADPYFANVLPNPWIRRSRTSPG